MVAVVGMIEYSFGAEIQSKRDLENKDLPHIWQNLVVLRRLLHQVSDDGSLLFINVVLSR